MKWAVLCHGGHLHTLVARGCRAPELTDKHRMLTCEARTTSNDSPETLPGIPVLLSPRLEPSLHTQKVQIFLWNFVCLLVFKRETAKIQRLFSKLKIFIFHGGKANPTTQVIAIQSLAWVKVPSRFLIFQGWKERFPWGPANDPCIMWGLCVRIHGITNLTFLEWLWRGCHESILSQSPIFIVSSIRGCPASCFRT